MRTYDHLGIQISRILLPDPAIDLAKWAVIACDQFTSQPEYWNKVRELVGNSPSTYNLVLPEVYLGTPEESARVQSTRAEMRRYLDAGLLVPHEGMILVERRTTGGKTRQGLMLCLDLEQYDFNPGARTLIRATEGTILDRLPPRIRIREGAPLELPHILVLIDDPEKTVIEPVAAQKGHLAQIYDFELMLGSGHLTGFSLAESGLETSVVQALEKLGTPTAFQSRYRVNPETPPLLFAVGDGNHSLATAKAIWEKTKTGVGPDHPARFALVEIENVHGEGLQFEPIHRVLFNVQADPLEGLKQAYPGQVSYEPSPGPEAIIEQVNASRGPQHSIGYLSPGTCGIVTIDQPTANLPVGSLQPFLDQFLITGGAGKIDYVHGEDVLCSLGVQPGNAGFYLPVMHKADLFRTVILDGVLPRKTFSMGEAREKRFYLESRRIDG